MWTGLPVSSSRGDATRAQVQACGVGRHVLPLMCCTSGCEDDAEHGERGLVGAAATLHTCTLVRCGGAEHGSSTVGRGRMSGATLHVLLPQIDSIKGERFEQGDGQHGMSTAARNATQLRPLPRPSLQRHAPKPACCSPALRLLEGSTVVGCHTLCRCTHGQRMRMR